VAERVIGRADRAGQASPQGFVVSSEQTIDLAQVAKVARLGRTDLYRPLDQRGRLGGAAQSGHDRAFQMQRLGVTRRGREILIQAAFGFGEPPCHLMLGRTPPQLVQRLGRRGGNHVAAPNPSTS
jgi:hypothetical protein